jgi:hypothetical protein
MDPRHLLPRHRQQPEGIVVPEILLDGERIVGEVRQLPAVLGMDAGSSKRRR